MIEAAPAFDMPKTAKTFAITTAMLFAAIVVAQLPGKDEQENPDKLKG